MHPRRSASIALAVIALGSASPAAADSTPQALPFTQDWSNIGLITAPDDWSGVPGVVGYNGATLTTASAVDPRTLLAPSAAGDIDVIANQTSTGLMTGGVAEFHVTNPAVALQGSGTAGAPHLVVSVVTTNIAFVRVSFNVRDLDSNADDAAQPIAVQYRVGTTGNFANVPDGYVADTTEPNLATKVTPVSVVLPADAGNQAIVQVRIITANALGSDEWIGIDDISITNATASPSAAGMSSPANAARGASVTLTASVISGVFPTSTGLGVVCDVTSIGGSATQALFDDGTNGDGLAGDNVWTFATTVANSSTAGSKTFACTVADTEARSSTFNIGFAVDAVCGDGIVEGLEGCDDNGTTAGNGCSETCSVESGYACTGQPSTCSDIDECTTNTDDCAPVAVCANTAGSFTCTCPTGYSGNGVGANGCVDIDECTADTDNCSANALCMNLGGGFTCVCPPGYTGDGRTTGTGCTDVDECTANTDLCIAEATCNNTPGNYSCVCPSGFSGDGRSNGTGCPDVDECTANSDNCDANATCTNTTGSFTCACKAGFTGSGTTCADVDECAAATDNCDANATCTNTAGSFTCACAAGYSGSGVTCTANCGNGAMMGPEACDDGNIVDGDGCTMNCVVEDGYNCTGAPSACAAVCGDGLRVAAEQCDDADTLGDDGCSADCEVEEGWTCTGEPSTCKPPEDGGCCSSSTHPGGVALLIMLVMIGLRRRQRT